MTYIIKLEYLTLRDKKPVTLGEKEDIVDAYDAAYSARPTVPLGRVIVVRDKETGTIIPDPRIR